LGGSVAKGGGAMNSKHGEQERKKSLIEQVAARGEGVMAYVKSKADILSGAEFATKMFDAKRAFVGGMAMVTVNAATLLGVLGNAGDNADRHEGCTILAEPVRPVALRLAILGGRVLLYQASGGAVYADPSMAEKALVIPPTQVGQFVDRELWQAPKLVLIAPPPEAGQDPLVHRAGDGAVDHVFWLNEAATMGELRAAGDAIMALAKAGEQRLQGTHILLKAQPGTWVSVAGQNAFLATARYSRWAPAHGWVIQVQGGLPGWESLAVRQVLPDEFGTIADYDGKQLKVTLPAHGITIPADLLAPAVSSGSVALAVPHVGDHGIVRFPGGANHAVYDAAPLPEGMLSVEDFKKLHLLLSAANVQIAVGIDGNLSLIAEDTYHAEAKAFDFRQKK